MELFTPSSPHLPFTPLDILIYSANSSFTASAPHLHIYTVYSICPESIHHLPVYSIYCLFSPHTLYLLLILIINISAYSSCVQLIPHLLHLLLLLPKYISLFMASILNLFDLSLFYTFHYSFTPYISQFLPHLFLITYSYFSVIYYILYSSFSTP